MTILRGKEIGESGGSRGEGQKNLRGVGDGGKGEGYIIIYGGEQSRQSWASWVLARYILSWEKLCGLFSASNWQNQKQRGKSMLCDIHQERQAWIKAIKTLLVYTTCIEYVIFFPRLPEPKPDNWKKILWWAPCSPELQYNKNWRNEYTNTK